MKPYFRRTRPVHREPWTRSHRQSVISMSVSLIGVVAGFGYFYHSNWMTKQANPGAPRTDEVQFDQILISPTFPLEPQQLVQALPIHHGDSASLSSIQSAKDALLNVAGVAGYAFAEVRYSSEINASANSENIKFYIEQAPRTFIQHIDISGNSRTLDEAIARMHMSVKGL